MKGRTLAVFLPFICTIALVAHPSTAARGVLSEVEGQQAQQGARAPEEPRLRLRSTGFADGVQLYRLDDPALLSPAGPVAVQALRLDPR